MSGREIVVVLKVKEKGADVKCPRKVKMCLKPEE
jgi:hypothetical protein